MNTVMIQYATKENSYEYMYNRYRLFKIVHILQSGLISNF
jgi:hypothetical protein